ncbi:MAG: LysR family transcriptional regulator [bacterium]
MELRELKTFCAVIEQGSFSKAGTIVNLSQPAVSLQVKSLENELHTKLLDRLDRKILPTSAGQILYHSAKGILSRIDQIKDELSESCGPKLRGKIIIGAGVTIGEGLMPHLLGSFKQKYPAVEIALRIMDTSEITKQMVAHELDLGIVGAEVNYKDLLIEKFTSDRLILIVSPSHPWSSKKIVTLKDLFTVPMLVREEGSVTRMHIRSELRKRSYSESDLTQLHEKIANSGYFSLSLKI